MKDLMRFVHFPTTSRNHIKNYLNPASIKNLKAYCKPEAAVPLSALNGSAMPWVSAGLSLILNRYFMIAPIHLGNLSCLGHEYDAIAFIFRFEMNKHFEVYGRAEPAIRINFQPHYISLSRNTLQT
jgi:hypothetical protein